MKKIVFLLVILLSLIILTSCSRKDYSGVYYGYSWAGEYKGITLDEASQKIESKMTLDKKGVITDFEMRFLVLADGEWRERSDPSATISFDTSVDPVISTLSNGEYTKGSSMFDIKTNDTMSLYISGVDEKGTVVYAFSEPLTRYLFEAKFPSDFNFDKTISDLTIMNGFLPTIRLSSGGLLKPESWDQYYEKSVLDFSIYSHVINLRGVYQGISNDTTIQDLLERSGVRFENGTPVPMEAVYGYHSAGGWYGNYKAISDYLIGRKATDMKGLVSYTGKAYNGNEYAKSIDENNFFGVNTDVVSGATASIQKSYDAIAGATVRISRENTSFQRALVAAGIIKEEEVIKGRF